MEKGNRVQEIKKRFEGLNSQNNDSSYIGKHPLISEPVDFPSCSVKEHLNLDQNINVKNVIKRSHAFRSDKSKIKPLNDNIPTFGPVCVRKDKVAAKEDYFHKVSPKSKLQLTNDTVLKPSNVILDKTRLQHLKNENPTLKSGILTDSLKKALKNPLPPGPAPKKPPRTFAHLGKSLDLEDILIERKKIIDQSSGSSISKNGIGIPTGHIVAFSQRSKTEPHIMLKKLESALLSNQAKSIPTSSNTKSVSPVINKNCDSIKSSALIPKAKVLCLNGFTSCISKNIYDTPFEPKSLTYSQSKKLSSSTLNQTPLYGTIHKDLDKRHIYEEPYTPKSEKKLNPPASKPSVHYMSSPVREPKRIQHEVIKFSSPNYQDKDIKMLTDAFNENGRSDSDADSIQEEKSGNHEEVTTVRKIYAKRVSSMRQQAPRIKQGQNLYEALLLIGIDQDLKLGKVPYLKSKYPESAYIPEGIPELVFPDAGDWPPATPIERRSHNNYTIAITAGDGSRKYAYCRRLQPEGAPFCLPLAYVIMSVHRDNNFYYSILAELEVRHGLPDADYLQFVQNLYRSVLPKPGHSIKIGEAVIQRAEDSRQESFELSRLLQKVSVPVFIKMLSTLLLERKVIIIGSNISVVSDCIEGLLKALFPFDWEHTLIGAVPSNRLELCTAPTPFLMGVVRPKGNPQSASFLPLKSIEDCFMVDVDSGEILVSCGDENSILPSRLTSCLRSALYLWPVHGCDVGPSEALIRLFMELVGHYNSHVITDVHTNNRRFQREEFIKAPRSRNVQNFLEWFTETAMFQSFIQRRLDRSFEPGLFEQRCAEYIEEIIKNNNISKKEKSLNKTVKIIGDRFKDWTSSS